MAIIYSNSKVIFKTTDNQLVQIIIENTANFQKQ